MDHERWYAFGRTQSLGNHDLPKLAVPRLCNRLHAAVDPGGGVYLDNVDVNGILAREHGPPAFVLAALLGSRLLDFYWRFLTVPFRGSYFSANRQFIAPLPIRLGDAGASTQLETLGARLHATASDAERERDGFLRWLEGATGVELRELAGRTRLRMPERLTVDELLTVLRANRSRLREDPDRRAFRELLAEELSRVDRTHRPISAGAGG